MNTTKSILKTIAIATAITLTSGTTALAHSNHDHSTVSYKWELSQGLKAKIENKLNSKNPSTLIGLNPFDQKMFAHYQIGVGNKFNTTFNGVHFLIERTSAGMKILDASRAENVAYSTKVPIHRVNTFSKISLGQKKHSNHDHAYLPYEWTFNEKTQAKIMDAMRAGKKDVYVGLKQFELALLKDYGIRSGNVFQTTIAGHTFMVEKASSGLKVVTHVEMNGMAMNTAGHSKM